jgi:hypothetical protein
MALLIVIFAYYCVRNTTQDLIYAITGRIPPSFIREQERIRRREANRPITANRGHRKFFRNAYNDAWETAEERRARWAGKRTQKRHEKWATEDGAAPAPVQTNARPEEALTTPAVAAPDVPGETAQPSEPAPPAPVVHDEDTYVLGGMRESLYQRYAIRRRNGGQPSTPVALADELDISMAEAAHVCNAWEARYHREIDPDQPPPHLLEYQKSSRCRDCSGPITLTKDQQRPGQWVVGVDHARDDCPQIPRSSTPREQHDEQVRQLADQATQDPARASGGSTTPEEETDVTTTIETTGNQSGIAYNEAMAKTCEEGATSVEQSIAALQNGEVGASVTDPMTQGKEYLKLAQACFETAGEELTSHLNVTEAYSANPDAGNKQFATSE